MGRESGRSLRGRGLRRDEVVLYQLVLLRNGWLSRCARLGHMVRHSNSHLINRLHGVSDPSSLTQMVRGNTLYRLKVSLPPSSGHLCGQKLSAIPNATRVRELAICLISHKRRLCSGKLRWEGVHLYTVRGEVWEGSVGEGCSRLEGR